MPFFISFIIRIVIVKLSGTHKYYWLTVTIIQNRFLYQPVRINKMCLDWIFSIVITRAGTKVEEIMARPSYIVAIIVIALTCVLAEELYSSRYDDIDIQAIFNNTKLRNQYYNCFMDFSPCKTADAKFFKGISDI